MYEEQIAYYDDYQHPYRDLVEAQRSSEGESLNLNPCASFVQGNHSEFDERGVLPNCSKLRGMPKKDL